MDNKFIERHAPEQIDTISVRDVAENMSESYALSLVTNTYHNYVAARSSSLDSKWAVADSLMNGQVERRLWPGTNTPKASYPQPIVSDNFRTILPMLEQAIFPDNEDWFSIEAATSAGIPAGVGRMLTNTLKYYLDVAPEIGKVSGRREIITALMDMLLYKVGGVFVYWSPEHKRPCVEAVNIREIYLDPKAVNSIAEMNKSIIWRKLMSIRQLRQLRGVKGFNIPTDAELNFLAGTTGVEPADVSKNVSSAMLMMNVQHGPDIYNPASEDAEIEVLMFFSKSRTIWVLNKQVVAYNEPNEYGFYPFAFAPCFALPHKNYGESVPDLLQSSQRLSEGLFNNYVDEIHLAMNPPRVEKKMSGVSQGDKWFPGLTIQVPGDPKADIIFPLQMGATTGVWDLLQFIASQSTARMGFSPMQVSGMAHPSNANRTASGMQMQLQSGNNRIYELVKLFEDYLMVPLLSKMLEYCRLHIKEGEVVEGLNENGDLTRVYGAVFHLPLRVQIKSASRVISKAAVMQMLPTITQYLLQGPFAQTLQNIGMTVDVGEVVTAWLENSGLGKTYQFVRPLTQQEQAQIQQAQKMAAERPDPTLQKTQMEIQGRLQETQMKGQFEINKEQIKKAPSPEQSALDIQKAQMDRELLQLKAELEQYKADAKAREIEMKMAADTQRAQMDSHKQQLDLIKAHLEMQAAIRKNNNQVGGDDGGFGGE